MVAARIEASAGDDDQRGRTCGCACEYGDGDDVSECDDHRRLHGYGRSQSHDRPIVLPPSQ